MVLDPREQRAAARAALNDDPGRRARVARIVTRIQHHPAHRHRQALRPTTNAQAWADFEAAEAANEREKDARL